MLHTLKDSGDTFALHTYYTSRIYLYLLRCFKTTEAVASHSVHKRALSLQQGHDIVDRSLAVSRPGGLPDTVFGVLVA